jgi:hypothetical protein
MKHAIPAILTLALYAPPAMAADPPEIAAILAQMRQASGGQAWAPVHALHLVTTATSGGATRSREHWEDVATGRYRVASAGPSGTTQAGFDGVTPWEQGGTGIAYTLGDVDSALVAADESFRVARAWWFADRHPATIVLSGERSEAGRRFDVLNITPEGGRPFEAWIDRSTHLLARTDEQQAEERVVTTYSDYRPEQGVMIPHTVRSGDGTDPSFDEVETLRSVEINPAISDASFSIPPVPASDIQLPPGRDSVDVPFRLAVNNRILVPVTLNGRLTVDADFDSGGGLLLQPGSVAKLGAVAEGRQKEGGGGEGATTATAGRLDTLAIGAATIPKLRFHSFAFSPDAPDEALVGQEILQRFVVRFDFDRMVITLTRPAAFRDPGRGAVVPFHFQDNQPEVKGSIDGIAGLFAIDTGDNSSLLLIAPFARKYGLVARYHADIPYEGTAITATNGVWARRRAHTVSLDGADGRAAVQVHNPVTRISLQHAGFDANRNVSANIGLGILRQFNLTFDYTRQRLIFEPSHFFGQPDIFNRTGFRLKQDGNAWTITTIYPDSPAAIAGLATGDRILTISGRAPMQIAVDGLAAILKGPVGTSVPLLIAAKSGSRVVRLKLRDVL